MASMTLRDPSAPMQIALLGMGSIGRFVRAGLEDTGAGPAALLVRRAADAQAKTPLPCFDDVRDLPDSITHLVDCAGHEGLAAHAPTALRRGINVVTLSLGALADEALARDLTSAAEAGGAKLHLASGAIGALDALRAARAGGLSHVRYSGVKPPSGWKGSPAEVVLDLDTITHPTSFFDGTARAAALAYPKNANVAAAVALAGLGFDATDVRLTADPAASGNTHRIEASGAFGGLAFEITGVALPDNPRSSALAAMSVLAEIRRLAAPVST